MLSQSIILLSAVVACIMESEMFRNVLVDTRSDRWFHGALRVISAQVAGQQSTNGLHYALERFETQCAMEPLSQDEWGKRRRNVAQQ